LPPISLGLSPGSGAAAEGVWMEGLLEGFLVAPGHSQVPVLG